jgi:hypothetical protein
VLGLLLAICFFCFAFLFALVGVSTWFASHWVTC